MTTVDHAHLDRLEAQSRRDHQAARQTLAATTDRATVDRLAHVSRDLAGDVRELQRLVARNVDVIAATDAHRAAMHLDALADLLAADDIRRGLTEAASRRVEADRARAQRW